MSDKPDRSFSERAFLRGEPSYIWRAGQERRLELIRRWGEDRMNGILLENGCGLGEYHSRIRQNARLAIGLDVEFSRLAEAGKSLTDLVCAAGESLPFPTNAFDLVLSNEVIEHVQNDRKAVQESVRVLKRKGRLILFCPNRGYPFETHGVYWKGNYHFGNKPLVNYLPNKWRNRLAPHVRAYTKGNLTALFEGLPVDFIHRTIIFGAYDNIIQKLPGVGKLLRTITRFLEKTPLRALGLSHFWVVEKQAH